MVHLEVLHVDRRVAQGEEDVAQHAGPVGDVDREPEELLRHQVAARQHAPAVLAGASDDGRDAILVRGPQRRLHLFQAGAVGAQHGEQRVAILEEDVRPHARVGAGDAREVAEAGPGAQQRVAGAVVLAGLCHERVGEHVWQVTHQGHEPVVLPRVDGDGARPDLVQKAEEQLQRGRLARARLGSGSTWRPRRARRWRWPRRPSPSRTADGRRPRDADRPR